VLRPASCRHGLPDAAWYGPGSRFTAARADPPDDLPAIISFRHSRASLAWLRRMSGNSQHPPGAEARFFSASQPGVAADTWPVQRRPQS
jgi:hypothetical protein